MDKQVDETLVKRNWLLGLRIQHEVLKDKRAEYGEEIIGKLSMQLTQRYGSNFGKRNLYHCIDFYKSFPNIFYAVSGESVESQIVNAVRSQSPIRLSWTHYRIILQESSEEGRTWYEREATREGWGTRTLQRNVSSQYYHRLLQSQDKALVHDEMQTLTRPHHRPSHPFPHGTGQGLCFCGQTEAHPYREGRLLHRPCFL